MSDPITDLALDVAERMLAANVDVHGRGYPPGASTMALLEGVAAVPPEHSVAVRRGRRRVRRRAARRSRPRPAS